MQIIRETHNFQVCFYENVSRRMSAATSFHRSQTIDSFQKVRLGKRVDVLNTVAQEHCVTENT